MVSLPRPDLNWPEAASADEDARLAERITGELRDRLADGGPCPSVLFAALPHPRFFPPAVQQIIDEASALPGFSVVARGDRAPAFTAPSAETFARILPAIVRRGPPEVVLVALCLEHDTGFMDEALLTAIQTGQELPSSIRFARAYYDSGDLMEVR